MLVNRQKLPCWSWQKYFNAQTNVRYGTEGQVVLYLQHSLNLPTKQNFTRLSEIPFDSEQKWMAVHVSYQNIATYFVKGAPDTIVGRCKKYLAQDGSLKSLSPDANDVCHSATAQLSGKGHRVLGLAYGSDLQDLTFVGLAAMYDPPRKGVSAAIAQLQSSGVRVVMITGDSEGTAVSVATQIGIARQSNQRGGGVMSGSELDTLTERQVQECIQGISVFYRTTPRHKLVIVRALQALGNVVAMTGNRTLCAVL
jgi:Ca2+-transporting ATPase